MSFWHDLLVDIIQHFSFTILMDNVVELLLIITNLLVL